MTAAAAHLAATTAPAASAILIDDREPEWVRQLHFAGAPVVTTRLDAGDLHVACVDGALIVIERKTASDLLNTLKDERLYPQMVGLREASPWAYLVITGALSPANGVTVADGRITGWNWASVMGALIDVQEMGVAVMLVASDTEFEAAILRLAGRNRAPLRITPPREAARVSDAVTLLTGLPGIGIERAAALLDHCGNAATALYALSQHPDDVEQQIPGVGTVTRRRVRQVLGLTDDQELAVCRRTYDTWPDYRPRTCGQCGAPKPNAVLHLCGNCFLTWRTATGEAVQ